MDESRRVNSTLDTIKHITTEKLRKMYGDRTLIENYLVIVKGIVSLMAFEPEFSQKIFDKRVKGVEILDIINSLYGDHQSSKYFASLYSLSIQDQLNVIECVLYGVRAGFEGVRIPKQRGINTYKLSQYRPLCSNK